MGLTKEYLRYVPAGNFNIIASINCNVKFVVLEKQEGRFVAAGASEHIIIWDLRIGEKAQTLPGDKSNVTSICANPNDRHLAAGYADGSVQIYDLKSAEVVSIFSGHKSEVTTLAYDAFGHKLASGSKDTDVIVWDTVTETGICRLSGHKGPITQVTFMQTHAVLVSASKDGLVKLWDLETQHCFRTLIGHRSEVWAVCLAKNDRYLITGCVDAELRVWKVIKQDDQPIGITSQLELTEITEDNDPRYPLRCITSGCLLRAGRGRVISMYMDRTGKVLICHGTDNQIELFHFYEDEESNTRLKKRMRKENKKIRKLNEDPTNADEPLELAEQTGLTLRDEVSRLPPIKLPDKPKSIDVITGAGGEIRVVTSLASNVLEMYSIKGARPDDIHLLRSIRAQGHRGEIRAIAFSSDNLAVVSGGADGVKLWNRPSQTCLRTTAQDDCYVVSICFVPGDRHVLAGLKDGRLLIIDIAAGDVLEEIPAHAQNTELWSVSLQPDLRGCITGGGDKTVKWWQFELINDESSESKARVLSLLHTKSLALEEGVLCVKLTPDNRFVAVALLDSTVKVFYADSFKLHVSLYGHKLPVLCMDVSFDSRLIATGSADRNVKLWGLDFGDCHKSLFAHDDSVTGVQFIANTHLFFTCGRDGSVRQWNADTFDRILTLPSHKGEAWSLAVSPDGRYVVTCGADRVIRSCERTDQPLVLEDEREEEREREESEHLATGDNSDRVIPGSGISIALPTRKTVGSERAADSLLECLEVSGVYREQLTEHAALQAASKQRLPVPAPPPLMMAFQTSTPEDFLLEIVKRIRSSELEEALLLLPFSAACEMLQYLPVLVSRGDEIELISKVLVFMLKVHHAAFVNNDSLVPLLKKLHSQIVTKSTELRDMIGYNLFGMQYIQREIESSEGVQLFRDATSDRKSKIKKRRRREKAKRSITVMTG